MARRWTEDEIARLCELYEQHDGNRHEIAALMGRSDDSVYNQMLRLGITRRRSAEWSSEEEQILREHYPNGIRAAMTALGRSYWSVATRANQMGLHVTGLRWTEDEIARLCEGYGVIDTGELAESLGRTRISLHEKARRMGLKCPTTRWKPEEHAS